MMEVVATAGAKDDGGGSDNWSCKTCSQNVTTNKPTPNFS